MGRAVCSQEGAQPRGRLQFCRRDRDSHRLSLFKGLPVQLRQQCSDTSYRHNHVRSIGLHVFGPFLICRSVHQNRGPRLLKHTPAGEEQGIDMPFPGFVGT